MIAYKFLRHGGVGPFSGFEWPLPEGDQPGAWVEAGGRVEPCARGVHACRPERLARWLDDELWACELDLEAEPERGVLVGRRGRLVHRIDGWNHEALRAFVEASAARAAERASAPSASDLLLAYAADAAAFAAKATTAQDAAEASYVAARVAEAEAPGGFDREREWQSRWLADRLGANGD